MVTERTLSSTPSSRVGRLLRSDSIGPADAGSRGKPSVFAGVASATMGIFSTDVMISFSVSNVVPRSEFHVPSFRA